MQHLFLVTHINNMPSSNDVMNEIKYRVINVINKQDFFFIERKNLFFCEY